MSIDSDYTVSSGNVFADLGDAQPDEALAKAQLAHGISGIIASRSWTQARAAAALGIDQPKVSALMRGQLRGFSTDRLIRFLTILDHNVQIVVTPKEPSQPHGQLTVTAPS